MAGSEGTPARHDILVLVRHGRTDLTATGRFAGQEDVALSEAGRNDAAECARRLAILFRECPISQRAVLSSDLHRARISADLIAASLHAAVHVDPGLREEHLGAWQGATHAEIAARSRGSTSSGVTAEPTPLRTGRVWIA